MKIKKNIFKSICVCFCLLCFILQGCSSKVFDNALLWKISGKDLQEPSYILGTHHLVNISFLQSITGFDEAFNNTDQVVGEIMISPETMIELQSKMLKSAQFAVGDSYKKILSSEDYDRLISELRNLFKNDISNFERIKPGFISAIISQMIYSQTDSEYNPIIHESIDAYLQRIAREQGKPTLGLETIDEQINSLFESESLKKQAETLICGLENIESGKEMFSKMDVLYKKGSLIEIYNLSLHNDVYPCPMSIRQANALIKDRNNKWLKILPTLMREKPSFIATGVLHLGGDEGLLSQLYNMGYTVEAVDEN